MWRLMALVPLILAAGSIYLVRSLRNQNHRWLEDDD